VDGGPALGAAAPPLYFVTMQRGAMREVVNAAHAKAGASSDSSFWGITPDAFGLSAEPPSFVVDVRDWVPRKLAALRCHRTQMGPHNPMAWLGDEEARRLLGVEQFRRSPLEATGDPMLEHLGEIQHAD
jgi:LmbE family N-acetylglucosaminyl deacetylase